MVVVPAGSFVMGSSVDEVCHKPTEEPQHNVSTPVDWEHSVCVADAAWSAEANRVAASAGSAARGSPAPPSLEPGSRERICCYVGCDMKYIARLLTALGTISAGAGYAQTLFPILESDVDASGTVLMCPKSNIYVPCRDTGSLLLPVALNLFPPRHRETPEANADASGAAQANANALGTVLMCPSRGGNYARCADAGALPPSVEVGRGPKLFAQVTTPYHARYGRRHYRQVRPKLFAQVTPRREGYGRRHHRHVYRSVW